MQQDKGYRHSIYLEYPEEASQMPQSPIGDDNRGLSPSPLPLNGIISIHNRILYPALKPQRNKSHRHSRRCSRRHHVPRYNRSTLLYCLDVHARSVSSQKIMGLRFLDECGFGEIKRVGEWDGVVVHRAYQQCDQREKRKDIEYGLEGNEVQVEDAKFDFRAYKRHNNLVSLLPGLPKKDKAKTKAQKTQDLYLVDQDPHELVLTAHRKRDPDSVFIPVANTPCSPQRQSENRDEKAVEMMDSTGKTLSLMAVPISRATKEHMYSILVRVEVKNTEKGRRT
ncbi:hypothetical protein BU17DRAFT_72126 [Hysterangium stoloniferum]|nr:hypothetical protein BU17DRAFT_72126 [Hysterangium stoloniferum]